jgi:hypothetical protein
MILKMFDETVYGYYFLSVLYFEYTVHFFNYCHRELHGKTYTPCVNFYSDEKYLNPFWEKVGRFLNYRID